MKNTILTWMLVFVSSFFTMSFGQEVNKLSTSEQKEGWKLLFDGKTLSGWRDYLGEDVKGPWKVEDGCLVSKGEGSDSTGYLISTDEYANFILTFDWKISKLGNSGFFYHVVERPQFKVPYVTGPEYQIIDDLGKGSSLVDWQSLGADYAMHAPDKNKKHVKEAGEWNSSKIVFDNGHVEYWLNGEKTVEFEAWTNDWFARKVGGKNLNAPEYGLARSGNFALQDHGSQAWYKNIKIKELPKKPKTEVLFNGKDLTGWERVGTELWYVENGEMICKSGPDKAEGYLETKKYYDDFDLTLDFKQVSDGNSGVFFRSFIKKATDISGWQVEIAPLGMHTGGIYESDHGRGWIAPLPADKENVLKKGEWNTMRILAIGNKVTTWLNGVKMVELNDAKVGRGKGRILLQVHNEDVPEIHWRNIKIRELTQ